MSEKTIIFLEADEWSKTVRSEKIKVKTADKDKRFIIAYFFEPHPHLKHYYLIEVTNLRKETIEKINSVISKFKKAWKNGKFTDVLAVMLEEAVLETESKKAFKYRKTKYYEDNSYQIILSSQKLARIPNYCVELEKIADKKKRRKRYAKRRSHPGPRPGYRKRKRRK